MRGKSAHHHPIFFVEAAIRINSISNLILLKPLLPKLKKYLHSLKSIANHETFTLDFSF